MNSSHGPLIYEGKAKRIFNCVNSDLVAVEFKNDATAFNAKKHSNIEGKGRLNCLISAYLFELLEDKGVPTHFVSLDSETWMTAKKVEIIPLEIVIRNVATGSLCRETPIPQGKELKPPLLDIYFKDDQLQDPILTESRLELLGLINTRQRKEIELLSRTVNKILSDFFESIDIILVDFKLEFGIDSLGKLVVADEISPDNCRLWDRNVTDSKDKILDKDRFRQDLGGLIDGYGEILKRIQANRLKQANQVIVS